MSPIAEKPKKVSNDELKVSEVPFPLTKAEEIGQEKKKIEELQKMSTLIKEMNLKTELEKKRTPKPPREEFL